MNILLVDDDVSILESLKAFLSKESFTIVTAQSISEARERLSTNIQLVILDWSLPDGQGIQLLKEWRQKSITTPVIMLTARAELIDKVLGLEVGADDYVTKPFEPRELLARISARLRTLATPHSQAHGQSLTKANYFSWGEVKIDLTARSAFNGEKSVELTKLEFELLKLFLEYPNQAFSRDELLNRVWGFENYPTTRTVDTHILQLRQKFPTLCFESIRGIGYKLVQV